MSDVISRLSEIADDPCEYSGWINLCTDARTEIEQLRKILRKLLQAEGDHMTACDRTMGATHPCTCGANEARRLLNE